MKEKTYQGPGVFQGLSISRAYKGKYIVIHIDNQAFIEVDLETALPMETDPHTKKIEPGLPYSEFFKERLLIEYPKEAEGDVTFSVVVE